MGRKKRSAMIVETSGPVEITATNQSPSKKTKKTKVLPPLLENPEGVTPATRPLCLQCGLWETCRSPLMPAYVPKGWTGKLLVLAEAPGEEEDDKNRPMVGKAGRLLHTLLADVGLSEMDVAYTNINRCRPVDNATPSLAQVRACRPFAVNDVLRLRPKWVLVMGDNASKGVWNHGQQATKRLRQRVFDGSTFFGDDATEIKVAFTYHPAATFYQKGQEILGRIREDLKWIAGFSGYVDGPSNETPDTTKAVALDAEWSDAFKLLTVSKAWQNKSLVTESEDEWTNWFADFIRSPSPILVGHSILGDLRVLRANGVPLPSTWISGEMLLDSVMLARLWNENLGAYDLESLSSSLCAVAPWKRKSESTGVKKHTDFSLLSPEVRMERCRLDSWASGLLVQYLIPKLDKRLVRYSHQLAASLGRVEMAGVKIDKDKFNAIKGLIDTQFSQRKVELENFAKANKWPDETTFECSNDNHFRTLLFDIMGATPTKYTAKDKEPAVGSAALTLIYQSGSDLEKEAVVKRLRYEKVEKLRSTYVRSLEGEDGEPGHLTPNNFIFQNINPLGARTGRRSSDSPNMQNWPKRMRSMVISRFPDGRIVKADYSQLEPRILAVLAGIDEWQEIFHTGRSLYIEVAKRMWRKDVEKDTPLYKVTKSTVLGTNYGMEVDLFIEKMSVEQGIHLTREQGLHILGLYHGAFPQLPRFFSLQKERLLANQQIDSMVGQIRHLPCPEGERTKGFKHMWNQAINFPVQCLASYFTGSSIIDLEREILSQVGIKLNEHFDNLIWHYGTEKISLDKSWLNGMLVGGGGEIDYPLIINEVHDEVAADCPSRDIDWLKPMMKETMEECKTLRQLWPETGKIKVVVEPVVSRAWVD